MIIPTLVSFPISTLLNSQFSAYSIKSLVLCSTLTCALRELSVIITLAGSFTYGTCAGSTLSSVSTILCECATLVTILRRTGVLNFSDISNAFLANTLDSSESDGSSIGSLAAIA